MHALRRSRGVLVALVALVGCEAPPAGARIDGGASVAPPPEATVVAPPAPPAPAPDGDGNGETTCTPGFTPFSKEAGHCSAHHTVCREGPTGPECHGGAILIPCGESGERCGQTFYCDCGDAGP